MATLQQIYQAYLNEDPNVSQMTYDPHGWNIEQTFDDTTTTDTTDTLPATGGITSAYYPPVVSGDSSGSITPLDPVNLGYAGLGDQTREFLIRAQEQAAKSPGYPGTQDDEESWLDSIPGLAWAKGKLGSLPSGVKKTGIAAAALGFLPPPLNLLGAAAPFLPKGEGYKVGGLDAFGKGAYDTLAAGGYLYMTPSGLKDIRGKNVIFGDALFGNNYIEGLQEDYDNMMEKYGGKTKFKNLLDKGKIKSKYQIDTFNIYQDLLGKGTYMDEYLSLKYPDKEVPDAIKEIKDGDKGAAPIDTKAVEDAIAAARYRDQAAKSPGYPGQVAPSATVAQATSTPSYSHPSAGVGAQASVDTSGSFAGKGTGNPFGRAKGGLIRKKYGTGGIVDLL